MQALRDIVIRTGSENLLWGYRKIVGELKKLGLHAPPPSLSLIKVQGPRTSNLGLEAIGSWIKDRAPRTSVLGAGASTAAVNNVI